MIALGGDWTVFLPAGAIAGLVVALQSGFYDQTANTGLVAGIVGFCAFTPLPFAQQFLAFGVGGMATGDSTTWRSTRPPRSSGGGFNEGEEITATINARIEPEGETALENNGVVSEPFTVTTLAILSQWGLPVGIVLPAVADGLILTPSWRSSSRSATPSRRRSSSGTSRRSRSETELEGVGFGTDDRRTATTSGRGRRTSRRSPGTSR